MGWKLGAVRGPCSQRCQSLVPTGSWQRSFCPSLPPVPLPVLGCGRPLTCAGAGGLQRWVSPWRQDPELFQPPRRCLADRIPQFSPCCSCRAGCNPRFLTSVPSLQDIKRCLNALEELGTLQVTSHILQKHTDVVATLKKVRGGLIDSWREGVTPLACHKGCQHLLPHAAVADPSLQSQQRSDGESCRSLHPVEVARPGTKDGGDPESQQSRSGEGQGGRGQEPGEAGGRGDAE